MSTTEHPEWICVGTPVITYVNDWDNSITDLAKTRIARVGKRDVVLEEHSATQPAIRFNVTEVDANLSGVAVCIPGYSRRQRIVMPANTPAADKIYAQFGAQTAIRSLRRVVDPKNGAITEVEATEIHRLASRLLSFTKQVEEHS